MTKTIDTIQCNHSEDVAYREASEESGGSVDKYMADAPVMYAEYLKLSGKSDLQQYKLRLKAFFRHTLNSHVFGNCALEATTDKDGFYLHPDGDAAESSLMQELSIDFAEFDRIFYSCDAVHAYT